MGRGGNCLYLVPVGQAPLAAQLVKNLHLEGVPGLPGAPQDEAGLTRKFETSQVGGATGRTPPIPRSALEKDPRPGPLFEGNAHGACALLAHTAQALGCSSGNRPRPALGCMHLPGLSRSGSGTWVVLRGAD